MEPLSESSCNSFHPPLISLFSLFSFSLSLSLRLSALLCFYSVFKSEKNTPHVTPHFTRAAPPSKRSLQNRVKVFAKQSEQIHKKTTTMSFHLEEDEPSHPEPISCHLCLCCRPTATAPRQCTRSVCPGWRTTRSV